MFYSSMLLLFTSNPDELLCLPLNEINRQKTKSRIIESVFVLQNLTGTFWVQSGVQCVIDSLNKWVVGYYGHNFKMNKNKRKWGGVVLWTG